MGEKVTKTVKVSASKADDWEAYIEENEHVDSMSHLIRLSVQREIQGKYKEAQRTATTDTADAASGEVLTTLRQIETGIGDLEDRLSAIERVNESDAGYDLKKAVYTLLPKDPEHVNPAGEIASEVPYLPEDSGAITAREIAQQLGADTEEVKDTLDELVETTGQVECNDTNHDGDYYWKKGQ